MMETSKGNRCLKGKQKSISRSTVKVVEGLKVENNFYFYFLFKKKINMCINGFIMKKLN